VLKSFCAAIQSVEGVEGISSTAVGEAPSCADSTEAVHDGLGAKGKSGIDSERSCSSASASPLNEAPRNIVKS